MVFLHIISAFYHAIKYTNLFILIYGNHAAIRLDFLEYVTMISWCNLHKFEEEND